MTKAFYHKLIGQAFGILKNKEDAEDAVQTTALKMLESKVTPDDLEAYIYTANRNNACLQFRDKHRKYAISDDVAISQVPADDVHIDPYAREVLLKALYTLPKKRLAVVKQLLADNEMTELPGDYNTNKAHYFLALRDLREYFRVEAKNRLRRVG